MTLGNSKKIVLTSFYNFNVICINKKFELTLMRRAKAYSSSG